MIKPMRSVTSWRNVQIPPLNPAIPLLMYHRLPKPGSIPMFLQNFMWVQFKPTLLSRNYQAKPPQRCLSKRPFRKVLFLSHVRKVNWPSSWWLSEGASLLVRSATLCELIIAFIHLEGLWDFDAILLQSPTVLFPKERRGQDRPFSTILTGPGMSFQVPKLDVFV